MESADSVERKWACVAVSNLIYNDPSTRRLLQGKNVVGTLIGRLTDSEQEVIVEAAGALRCVLSFFLFFIFPSSILFSCPRFRFVPSVSLLSEICASMVDMIFVRRCTTRISSRRWRRSSLKYVYVCVVLARMHQNIFLVLPKTKKKHSICLIFVWVILANLGHFLFFSLGSPASRFRQLWRNILILQRRRRRTPRRWCTNLPKTLSPSCGVSREF